MNKSQVNIDDEKGVHKVELDNDAAIEKDKTIHSVACEPYVELDKLTPRIFDREQRGGYSNRDSITAELTLDRAHCQILFCLLVFNI